MHPTGTSSGPFTGFPNELIPFLEGIRAGNDKAWFDAHRAEYEQHYLAPAKAFVEAAGEALRVVAPEVRAEPRVNGSIFRVNRDIRFSKDKRPYKDYLDLWMWDGAGRNQAVSGFYLRIAPEQLSIGAGAHSFDKNRLAGYRTLVVDTEAGPALLDAVEAVEKAGFPVQGEHYKRVPAPYEARGRAADLLRHNALWAGEDTDLPKSLHSKAFVGYCTRRWEKLAPLHRWLVDRLQ